MDATAVRRVAGGQQRTHGFRRPSPPWKTRGTVNRLVNGPFAKSSQGGDENRTPSNKGSWCRQQQINNYIWSNILTLFLKSLKNMFIFVSRLSEYNTHIYIYIYKYTDSNWSPSSFRLWRQRLGVSCWVLWHVLVKGHMYSSFIRIPMFLIDGLHLHIWCGKRFCTYDMVNEIPDDSSSC